MKRGPSTPHELTRRDFLLAGAGAGLYLTLGGSSLAGRAAAQAAPDGLDVLSAGYPRAFFFRQVEQAATRLSYEKWEKRFLPLDGIMGKVFREAVPTVGDNNLTYFRRYKANNPGKAVFLHYDAASRRPVDGGLTGFFPGHWLHYAGTKLTRPARASRTAAVLYVGNTSVFKVGRAVGIRGERVNDDISIVPVVNGKPDWRRGVEQVRLRGINARAGTISVERAAYGSRPLAWRAGAYLAAHVITGPVDEDGGPTGEPMWHYNYSTLGPKDARGRTGADALVDYLVEKLGPRGPLATFDGISLDTFAFSTRANGDENVDANGDGRADGGIIGGADTVSLGRFGFTRDLRARLPDKILIADGVIPDDQGPQRSFAHLNGVETEGYPEVHDVNLDEISSGENRFNFWRENGVSPSLNYIQYKYFDARTGARRNLFSEPSLTSDKSYKKLRLALASAQFTDAAFATRGGLGNIGSWGPPETTWNFENGSAEVQVFDELWRGVDQVPHWLGSPTGETVHLAGRSPDLLKGQGERWPSAFVGRFRGTGVAFSRTPTGMSARSTRAWGSTPVLRRAVAFALPNVNVPGRDLFVTLRLRADGLRGYPSTVARRASVTVAPAGRPARWSLFTWAGREAFTARFFFKNVGPGRFDLGFNVEGDTAVHFEGLTAHSVAAGPSGGVYREFQNGAVFANLSTDRYDFDLATLLPGSSFQRIQGVSNQDPATNDGSPVLGTLSLPSRDALFVMRTVTGP